MRKNRSAPGLRFHPTDVELVLYYLKRKVLAKKFYVNAPITEVDIYKHAPWDLPDKSYLKTGDLKWYFFCPIAKKYGKGGRLNRTAVDGYWKTTGKDRPVKNNGEVVGMKKTLVFHRGKAPSGERTDWVMHEYKLQDKKLTDIGIAQDSYVLCEVFEKEGMGPKNGAQYGAPFKEEDWSDDDEEEETILPGTTSSLCDMSATAVGGASSSLVHESHVGPFVESCGLYNLSLDTCTSAIDTTSYAPTYAFGDPTWTSAIDTFVSAAPKFVDAHPEAPLVADAETVADVETVPAILEVARDEEPNTNILTLLDSFHANDAFLHRDDQMKQPQVSNEDNDVASLLKSFTEVDDPSNWSYIF